MQYKAEQPKAVQQHSTTTLHRIEQDNPPHHNVIQWKSIDNNTGKLQSHTMAKIKGGKCATLVLTFLCDDFPYCI